MYDNEILLILGNQLFPIEYIKKTKVKKIFMAEDFGLATNHKHHKLKIFMFLASMRQYRAVSYTHLTLPTNREV